MVARTRLSVLLFLPVVAGGVWLGRLVTPAPPPAAAAESLDADPQTLNLGRVWAVKHFPHAVRVHNPGPHPARLDSLVGDCSCAAAAGLPRTIAPGESAAVELALDLTRWAPADVAQVRPLKVKLTGTWQSAAGSANRTWELTGDVRAALRAEPAEVHIGVQSVRLPAVERVVRVEAAEEVTDLRAELPAHWEAAVGRDGPRRFLVTLRAKGPLAPRMVADVVQLVPVGRDGPLPGIEVRVTGELSPDILAVPKLVSFGRREIGAVSSENVRFESLTKRPFRVAAARSADPVVEVAADAERPGVYEVRLCPTATGDRVAVVAFDVVDEHGASAVVAVSVHYTGVAPANPDPSGR